MKNRDEIVAALDRAILALRDAEIRFCCDKSGGAVGSDGACDVDAEEECCDGCFDAWAFEDIRSEAESVRDRMMNEAIA